MRAHEIMEAHRAPLFHTTTRLKLAYILATDRLDDLTTDTAMIVPFEQSGVSLTRSYEFARRYKSASRRGLPTLVLDATFLTTKPVSYWNGRISDWQKPDEMEEWHKGGIYPLSKYLISINSNIPFEAWLSDVQNTLSDTEFVDSQRGATSSPVDLAAKTDFSQFASLWNRWQPVRGIAA